MIACTRITVMRTCFRPRARTFHSASAHLISSPIIDPSKASPSAQFSYELFGCGLSFRIGRIVIWRHDATHLTAPDGNPSADLLGNGRAPVRRLPLIGDYRKLRNVSH